MKGSTWPRRTASRAWASICPAKLDALDKARRSKNRGTRVGTFPYWKILAAAVFWGFGVAATISLIVNGAPWWNAFLLWLFVAIVTFCIALGCVDG